VAGLIDHGRFGIQSAARRAQAAPDVGSIVQVQRAPWQTALKNVTLSGSRVMRRAVAEYRTKDEELIALVGAGLSAEKGPRKL